MYITGNKNKKQNYLKYVTCHAGISGNVLLLFFIVIYTVIDRFYL